MVREAAAVCRERLQPCVLEAFRHEKTDVHLPGDGRAGSAGANDPGGLRWWGSTT